MSREPLGQFELTVMLAMLRVGEDAYGVPIARALEAATGRPVLLGSVYAALGRLEAKGVVTSAVGEPTAARGGRAKKYFRVTVKGMRQVQEAQRTLTALWRRIPALQRGS